VELNFARLKRAPSICPVSLQRPLARRRWIAPSGPEKPGAGPPGGGGPDCTHASESLASPFPSSKLAPPLRHPVGPYDFKRPSPRNDSSAVLDRGASNGRNCTHERLLKTTTTKVPTRSTPPSRGRELYSVSSTLHAEFDGPRPPRQDSRCRAYQPTHGIALGYLAVSLVARLRRARLS